ncbi:MULTISPECIES: SMC-Scp complex subunit ScpB [unclassified Breznakia]|uniref:SMC-Scp complex subunit ScpB n=1 Tax=unclassified Breznakia TaxID=2623764 RepID=UPI002473795A|nr:MULTISPECIES: SMC-Scp complex subunit ScpB [unclassified Breznakia]MDH6367701.1 segregation and condensation protein B [Breznakia sp. PH1-1]MDH6404789.1 segregation and condensation protein B [Breznakia sp. PF1-11]MDH6412504.1 segregation and condensation protein B [Breznakia sp. PFB1-11]MDH6414864.1 segregation and condensation protein B [Breznakia sp. PFB1-14]MDH6417175.1 segregation and condensation protein B [Breznakia sp. PFB1-4]
MQDIIEGLLFLAGDEGLSDQQLLETLEIKQNELESYMDSLMDEYLQNQHGVELIHFGGRYKFVSKEHVYEYAAKLFSSNKMATLSSAALETLAIIAYKQPITRSEIEEIRGVGADMMIRKLLARGLIKECGRSDAPGRPFLYEVTEEFMDSFQLQSLKELPELEDHKVVVQEELFDNR